MKRLFFYNFIIIFVFSCTHLSPDEKKIKYALGKTVNISIFDSIQQEGRYLPYQEFRDKYNFVLLVYLEDACQPCYPKFIEWQTKMDTLVLNDDFTVLFIIQGRSYEKFLNYLHESEPDYNLNSNMFYVVMDSAYSFLENNADIEREIIDKSILIDAENKIRLIGPPYASLRMTELFYSICRN